MVKFAAATLGLTPCPQTPLLRKTDVGHTGGTFGFSSGLAYDFDKRRALVVLSNCRDDSIIDRLSVLLKGCPQAFRHDCRKLESRCAVLRSILRKRPRHPHSREGGRLMLQEWGKPRCEIFPQSETNFYNQLFDCRAAFDRASNSPGVNELVIGNPVKPTWRGVKILGSSSPFTEDDCQPRKDSDLQGVWQATLRPSWYWPFYALHPKLKMAELSPGAFRAELETIDKRPSHLPLTVAYHPPSVDISMLPFEATFHGKMNPACTSSHGLLEGKRPHNPHHLSASHSTSATKLSRFCRAGSRGKTSSTPSMSRNRRRDRRRSRSINQPRLLRIERADAVFRPLADDAVVLFVHRFNHRARAAADAVLALILALGSPADAVVHDGAVIVGQIADDPIRFRDPIVITARARA